MRNWDCCQFLAFAVCMLYAPAAVTARAPNDEPSSEPPPMLSEKVVAAWKSAGAEVGWMRPLETGYLFFGAEYQGTAGELPAFRLVLSRTPEALDQVPEPASAF